LHQVNYIPKVIITCGYGQGFRDQNEEGIWMSDKPYIPLGSWTTTRGSMILV
jgi:hypothetical protein